jgi:uncharacterized protein YsxB (DUF464 family)
LEKKIVPTSLNIVCSAISKFLTVFIPDFNFAQSNLVKKQKIYKKYQDIQIYGKIRKNIINKINSNFYRQVLLGFFHMLRPIEAWSSELIQKPELKISNNK